LTEKYNLSIILSTTVHQYDNGFKEMDDESSSTAAVTSQISCTVHTLTRTARRIHTTHSQGESGSTVSPAVLITNKNVDVIDAINANHNDTALLLLSTFMKHKFLSPSNVPIDCSTVSEIDMSSGISYKHPETSLQNVAQLVNCSRQKDR